MGSGKTTLLLRIAKKLVKDGRRKLAIIENEIGKVGVDDQSIQAEGLTVKELFSGCICCSMRIDLVRTLLELEKEHKPDLVIIEPSGVAGPHLVVDALSGYGGEIDRKLVVLLMDATRPSLLLNNPPVPIVERGVGAGDIILINKIDQAEPESVKSLELCIREMRPNVRIAMISALTGEGTEQMSDLFDEMLSPIRKEKAEIIETLETGLTDTDAVVFSEKISFAFETPMKSDDAEYKLAGILDSLREKLEQDGCTMIGHIKAILRDDEKPGYLLMSLTDFKMKPSRRGAVAASIVKVSITLNAIVYGINPLILSLSARSLLQSFKSDKLVTR